MTLTKYAELKKGNVLRPRNDRHLKRWYYVVKSRNGQVLSTSQRYFSKWNCHRAALRAGYAVHG